MIVNFPEEVEDLTGRINKALVILNKDESKTTDARLRFKVLAIEDAKEELAYQVAENSSPSLLVNYAMFLDEKINSSKGTNVGAYGGYGLVRDYVRAYGV